MLKKIVVCLALSGAPHVVAAQSVQDSIISQLQAQGFDNFSLNRTWLGRVRVVSYRDGLRRELVFNPQTGEILRDYWRNVDDDDGPTLFNPSGSSGTSGNGGSGGNGAGSDDDEAGENDSGSNNDDDDRDDDEDDDDEDDRDDDDDDEDDRDDDDDDGEDDDDE